jgi:VWFA-related protein
MGRFSRFFPVLLLLSPFGLSGQNSPPAQPGTAGPSNPPPGGTDRQTLVVQVTDKSGAAIRGLQKQDFSLLDDKQPKDILSFHAVDTAESQASDPPVELVVVIDAVNVDRQAVASQRLELKKFLLRNGGKLAMPMSLVVFTETGTRVQKGFSRDGNALAELFDKFEIALPSSEERRRSEGLAGDLDRFNKSMQTLTSLLASEEMRPGRKLIIWFSAGWPWLSRPDADPSSKDRQRFFDSIVATSAALRRGHITLYSIDSQGIPSIRTNYSIDPQATSSAGVFSYKGFLKGVTDTKHALPGNLGLQVLAAQSGGRVVNSTNDLAGAIADCIKDADAYYLLSFAAARASQPNEYHDLGVTVGTPGATVRTRTGYYVQP